MKKFLITILTIICISCTNYECSVESPTKIIDLPNNFVQFYMNKENDKILALQNSTFNIIDMKKNQIECAKKNTNYLPLESYFPISKVIPFYVFPTRNYHDLKYFRNQIDKNKNTENELFANKMYNNLFAEKLKIPLENLRSCVITQNEKNESFFWITTFDKKSEKFNSLLEIEKNLTTFYLCEITTFKVIKKIEINFIGEGLISPNFKELIFTRSNKITISEITENDEVRNKHTFLYEDDFFNFDYWSLKSVKISQDFIAIAQTYMNRSLRSSPSERLLIYDKKSKKIIFHLTTNYPVFIEDFFVSKKENFTAIITSENKMIIYKNFFQ